MSDSVWPHRQQPTRLPHPWDYPGKKTGVGCHFLLQCMKVKSESDVAQSCLTLSDPMDCSLPGSSVHGIFQARVLEWGAIAFSVMKATGVHFHQDLLLGSWIYWLHLIFYTVCFLFMELLSTSTVHEPWTSRHSSWILKRQRNQRSNCQHLSDHQKSKRVLEEHLLLLHWLCQRLWLYGSQQTLENSLRDGNTRPPDLPPEISVCRSRSSS